MEDSLFHQPYRLCTTSQPAGTSTARSSTATPLGSHPGNLLKASGPLRSAGSLKVSFNPPSELINSFTFRILSGKRGLRHSDRMLCIAAAHAPLASPSPPALASAAVAIATRRSPTYFSYPVYSVAVASFKITAGGKQYEDAWKPPPATLGNEPLGRPCTSLARYAPGSPSVHVIPRAGKSLLRVEGPREASERRGGVEGCVRSGVEKVRRDRNRGVRGEEKRTVRREIKSLRIGVHHADAVVWGPV
jgi:hypothetical protein